MAPAVPAVVSLELQEDDSTVIVLRVNRQWMYAEANRSDLSNVKIRRQYDDLVRGYRQEQKEEDQREQEVTQSSKDPAKDSGYGSGEDATSPKQSLEAQLACEDGRDLLQSWMLEVLASTCDQIAAQETEGDKVSLAKWYDAAIHFYNITANAADSGHLSVESREDLDGLKYLRDYILPHIRAPKYLQDLDVPWYAPEDVIVEEEREDMHASIHPTMLSVPTDQVPSSIEAIDASNTSQDNPVQKPGNHSEEATPSRTQYFFKMATHGDAKAVKREIKILETLRKKDLYSKGVRAPHLAGLVQLPQTFCDETRNAKSELLGIMITTIPPPAVPLQRYMDSSIAQEKRAAYAAEAQVMVDVLHEHDIVWGDAKADNFLVDGEGKLWMIDFGGSYTPGWIDAELANTMEGDDMGTEKITLGLEYPDEVVQGGEDENCEKNAERAEDVVNGTKRKREDRDRADDTSEDEGNDEPTSQRSRR